MNWLGYEDLGFVQTLNNEEKEKCKTSSGLFEVLSDKFKPEHNKMILSLQYCKLEREQYENVEEWLGYLKNGQENVITKKRIGGCKNNS